MKWGIQHPREMFLVDGLSALLSAFLLGIVLVTFEELFGVPKSTLYFLASLPCIFFVYDFYWYFNVNKTSSLFLKIIAIANLLYCF